MEGVLFRGQLGKSDQIVNDGPQGSFARYMGPSLVMVPTIKCNLVAGNSCLTKLTEQLFVQQITIGGHIGSIVKAILFLQILHNVGHFQHSVFAKSRFTSKPCKYDLFIARRLCSYILLNSEQSIQFILTLTSRIE